MQVILKCHVVSAALQYFNMPSVDDDLPPQVLGDITQAPLCQRRGIFNQIVCKVIESVVQLPNNPGTECAVIESDGVYKYAQEVMTLILLHAEFEDSIKEGDVQRVITCWKFFLLIFKAANRTKYVLEAVTLLISLQVLPYRLQQQFTWYRFVNTRGQPASISHVTCIWSTSIVLQNMQHNNIKDSLTYRPSSQGWASRVLPLMYVYLFCSMLDTGFCGWFYFLSFFLLYILASML